MSGLKNKYPYGYMKTSGTNLLDGNGDYIGDEFNVSSYSNSCFLDLLSASDERTYKLQKYNGIEFVDEANLNAGEEAFVEIEAGATLRFVVEDGVGGDALYSYAIGFRNDLDDHSSESTEYLTSSASSNSSSSSSSSSSSLGFSVSSESSSSSVEVQTDINTIFSNGDVFGMDGDISDHFFAIGVPTYDKELPDSVTILSTGAVYVYMKKDSSDNEWGELFLIEPPKLDTNQEFGKNVAMNDNYLVASSLNASEIYVYKRFGRNNWELIQTIASNQNDPKLAMSGDIMVIGENEDTSNTGRVRVFLRTGPESWTESTTLSEISGESEDQFGYSVDVDGDYVVVGAPYDDISGFSNSGSVYVFYKTGPSAWDYGFRIDTEDRKNNYNFGKSVKISGDFISVLANDGINRVCYLEKRNSSYDNLWDSETVISSVSSAEIDSSYLPCVTNGYYHDNMFYYKNTVEDGWVKASSVALNQNCFGSDGLRFGFNKNATSIDMHLITEIEEFSSDESSSTEDRLSTLSSTSSEVNLGEINLLYEATDALAGRAMAAYGDYFVIGGDEKVYVFYRDSITKVWSSPVQLVANDGSSGDGFGYSVDIYGNYIIVGAPFKNASNGGVYSFRNSGANNWGAPIRIVSSSPMAGEQFGRSVSAFGSYIAVGSYSETHVNVYFRVGLNSYTDGFDLFDVCPNPKDGLGRAVQLLDSNTLVCGGTALRVFKRTAINTWKYSYQIDGNSDSQYAQIMDSNGKYISVSNPLVEEVDIYVNLEKQIDLFDKVTISAIQSNEEFGYSVGIDGQSNVSSAGFFDNVGQERTNSGALHIHRRTGLNTWNLFKTVEINFPLNNEYFGDVVAIGSGTIFTRAMRNASERRIYYIDFEEENSSSSSSSTENSESDSSSSAGSDSFNVNIDLTSNPAGSVMASISGNPAMVFFRTSNQNLFYSRANDAVGSSWSAPVLIASNCYNYRSGIVSLSNGKPMVVFSYNGNAESKIADDVAGSSWTQNSVVIKTDVSSSSIAVSLNPINDISAVAIVMNGAMSFFNADSASPASWSLAKSTAIDFSGYSLSFLYTASNLPALAYTHYSNLLFLKCDNNSGSGNWSSTVVDTGVGSWMSMATVVDGPSIAYSKNNKLYYIHSSNEGSTWGTPELVSSSWVSTDYISMTNCNGRAVISFKLDSGLAVAVRLKANSWVIYRLNGNESLVQGTSILSFGDAVGVSSSVSGKTDYSFLSLT